MLTKLVVGSLAAVITLALIACAPAAVPTPTPTKAPVAAPTKAAEPTKPPAEKPAATATVASPPQATVKVGHLSAAGDGGIYVALDKGYFKEQGIEIELAPFKLGGEMIPPVGTGQIDIASGGLSAGLFNSMARGVNLRIVADKGRARSGGFGQTTLVIRKDLADSGAIKTIADLKGRKVGLPASLEVGSLNQWSLETGLKKVGLTLQDIDPVVVNVADTPVALGNKSVDAVWGVEPWPTIAVENGLAVRMMTAADTNPDMQGSVLVYSPQFAQDRQEVAKRFMVAYLKGVRFFNDAMARNKGKDEALSIVIKYGTVKERPILEKMEWAWVNPDGYVSDTMYDFLDYLASKGLVQQKPDLKKFVDTTFIEYALDKLGKYQ